MNYVLGVNNPNAFGSITLIREKNFLNNVDIFFVFFQIKAYVILEEVSCLCAVTELKI